jgi:Glycerophosphoryl diester phosphodiesterase
VLMIGHRGAKGYAPENTLLSVRKAMELGVDCVEVDVHLLGEDLIVLHDETLERTTNGHGRLENYSFEEIRRLDAGLGEKIPTLQEVLAVTHGVVDLNIELKGKGSSDALIKILDNPLFDDHEKLLISSFLIEELRTLRAWNSGLKIGVLASHNLDESFDWCIKLKAFSLHINRQQLTLDIIKKAHRSGLKLYVYTVNDRKEMERMEKIGVDAVFSDFPDRRPA